MKMGNSIAASIAMIAMTTSSSIRVKPVRFLIEFPLHPSESAPVQPCSLGIYSNTTFCVDVKGTLLQDVATARASPVFRIHRNRVAAEATGRSLA